MRKIGKVYFDPNTILANSIKFIYRHSRKPGEGLIKVGKDL